MDLLARSQRKAEFYCWAVLLHQLMEDIVAGILIPHSPDDALIFATLTPI